MALDCGAQVSYGPTSTSASLSAALAAAVGGSTSPSSGALTLTGPSNEGYQVAIVDSSGGASPFAASPASGNFSGGVLTTGATLYSYDLSQPGSYALNGNITQVTDSVQGTWQYGYDWLNRLTSAATGTAPYGSDPYSPGTVGWTYDIYGNRTSQSLTGVTPISLIQPNYSYTGNRMNGLCYDAAGNVLSSESGYRGT